MGGAACFPLLSKRNVSQTCVHGWLKSKNTRSKTCCQKRQPSLSRFSQWFSSLSSCFSFSWLLRPPVALLRRHLQHFQDSAQGHHSALPGLRSLRSVHTHTKATVIGVNGKDIIRIRSKKMVCRWLGVQQNHINLQGRHHAALQRECLSVCRDRNLWSHHYLWQDQSRWTVCLLHPRHVAFDFHGPATGPNGPIY